MNASRLCLGLWLLLLLVAPLSSHAVIFTHYYDSKAYEFEIDLNKLSETAKWDLKTSANPPVSAQEALKKAGEFIKRYPVKDSARQFWSHEGITLKPLKEYRQAGSLLGTIVGWVWQVDYLMLPTFGGSSGQPSQMSCYILMDGTVVEPKLASRNRSLMLTPTTK